MLVFDTLPGLFIGIGISLLLLLYRASRPYIAVLGRAPGSADQYGDVDRHPENETFDGIIVVRVEAGLYFANADSIRARIEQLAGTARVVVLDAETIAFIDVTAARMLEQLVDDLRRRGGRLLVARDVGEVRDILSRVSSDDELLHVFPTVQAAVDAVTARATVS